MTGIAPIDLAALALLVLSWIGYTRFADHQLSRRPTLLGAMQRYRLLWFRQLVERDQRVVDSTIVGNLVRGVTFFASTTIFLLAGLLAVLGAIDPAIAVLGELRFAVTTSRALFELKLFTLILIFVYGFFKFSWSLRQFNYCSVMVGAAPPPEAAPDAKLRFAERASLVSSIAANNFNRGLRAYYFGLATLAWFLHPLLFIAAIVLVVAILYRREFRSGTLAALGDPGDFDPACRRGIGEHR